VGVSEGGVARVKKCPRNWKLGKEITKINACDQCLLQVIMIQ